MSIRTRSGTWCVPYDQGEVVAEGIKLVPPVRSTVAYVTVDEDDGTPVPDAFISNAKPFDLMAMATPEDKSPSAHRMP